MLSAPLIGFIAVRDRYDQEQCLRAGRIWQRAHLPATARGLAARPSNEAVEMVDHERALGQSGGQTDENVLARSVGARSEFVRRCPTVRLQRRVGIPTEKDGNLSGEALRRAASSSQRPDRDDR